MQPTSMKLESCIRVLAQPDGGKVIFYLFVIETPSKAASNTPGSSRSIRASSSASVCPTINSSSPRPPRFPLNTRLFVLPRRYYGGGAAYSISIDVFYFGLGNFLVVRRIGEVCLSVGTGVTGVMVPAGVLFLTATQLCCSSKTII